MNKLHVHFLLMDDVYLVFPPKDSGLMCPMPENFTMKSDAIDDAISFMHTPSDVDAVGRKKLWDRLYQKGWRTRKVDLYFDYKEQQK